MVKDWVEAFKCKNLLYICTEGFILIIGLIGSS